MAQITRTGPKIAMGAGAGVVVPLGIEVATGAKRIKAVGNMKTSTVVGGTLGLLVLGAGLTETGVNGLNADVCAAAGASMIATSAGLEALPRIAKSKMAAGGSLQNMEDEIELGDFGLESGGGSMGDFGFYVGGVREV